MSTTLLLAALAIGSPQAGDPHRQFDFWIGEWSVLNRHLQPDGTWVDGDTTRARITPVCGRRAVLEEWAGPFHGAFMNGFSLRAWDPGAQRWALLLFWTTDGNGSFGRLEGSFRHGRGEFFAPAAGAQRTRYTFADALPDSVRWDSATSGDGGVRWKTDWIMEFRRTRAAAEVTQDLLFAEAWTEGELSPHPAARELDWLLGSWTGSRVDAAGVEREARLRCKLLDKDCLVLDLLETRAAGAEDWDERLCVRGWTPAGQAWESWCVREDDTRLRHYQGSRDLDVAIFEHVDPVSGAVLQEVLAQLDPDRAQIEVTRRAPGATSAEIVSITTLERLP